MPDTYRSPQHAADARRVDATPAGDSSVATTLRSAAKGSMTWSDPNGLTSAHSINAATGRVSMTLDASEGVQGPADSAGYHAEVLGAGASITAATVSGWLRVVLDDLGPILDDSDDAVVALFLLDGTDRSTANGWGVGLRRRELSADPNSVVFGVEAGVYAEQRTYNGTGGGADHRATEGNVQWDSVIEFPKSHLLDVTTGAKLGTGRLTSGAQAKVTVDYSSGAWIHLVAWRETGDGVAPNDTAITISAGGLYQLVALPSTDIDGTAP